MKKHIVLIGRGFEGINLIKSIAPNKSFRIMLVNRNNYHCFPPLIYQVSNTFIEPSQISYPFRKLLSNYDNVGFHMGSLLKINTEIQQIATDTEAIDYYYLGLKNVKTVYCQ